jgi:hypothetical protein
MAACACGVGESQHHCFAVLHHVRALRKQESWASPRFLKVSRAAGAALPRFLTCNFSQLGGAGGTGGVAET